MFQVFAFSFVWNGEMYIDWGIDQIDAFTNLCKNALIPRGQTVSMLDYMPLHYSEFAYNTYEKIIKRKLDLAGTKTT